jgi:hypothetical protein
LAQYLAGKPGNYENDPEVEEIYRASSRIMKSDKDEISAGKGQESKQPEDKSIASIEPVGSDRIRVIIPRDSSEKQKIFECDRFCPHKGADLLQVCICAILFCDVMYDSGASPGLEFS